MPSLTASLHFKLEHERDKLCRHCGRNMYGGSSKTRARHSRTLPHS